MPIVRATWISREDLRRNGGSLFVFGDNMERRGRGGQAKEMRGEPNAVGIPTKWQPDNDPGSFFFDNDWGWVMPEIERGMSQIESHLKAGGTVVIPARGIGTGLSDLQNRAPAIARMIQDRLEELERTYGSRTEASA